jgi:hypothetical protein
METREVCKLSELVHLIEELRSRQGNVLFRGTRRDWDLLPGIARPAAREPVLDVEQRMLKKFQRESLPFLEMRPETELDWLAVAQHYGSLQLQRGASFSTNAGGAPVREEPEEGVDPTPLLHELSFRSEPSGHQ